MSVVVAVFVSVVVSVAVLSVVSVVVAVVVYQNGVCGCGCGCGVCGVCSVSAKLPVIRTVNRGLTLIRKRRIWAPGV